MKLPFAPLQRAALGVAGCAFIAVSVSAVALITQPASSTGEGLRTNMTFEQPPADDTTTTTEPTTLVTMAEEALGAPQRAEQAAVRAEVAASRAEVAATHVDEIVATTTTTMAAPTTSSTFITRTTQPVGLVGTILPMESTTTTTTLPKRWVEIARIPVAGTGFEPSGPPPVELHLTFMTGQIRVSDANAPYGPGIAGANAPIAAWIGATDAPGEEACYPYQGCQAWQVPTGEQILRIGQGYYPVQGASVDHGWHAPFATRTDITIEEYR